MTKKGVEVVREPAPHCYPPATRSRIHTPLTEYFPFRAPPPNSDIYTHTPTHTHARIYAYGRFSIGLCCTGIEKEEIRLMLRTGTGRQTHLTSKVLYCLNFWHSSFCTCCTGRGRQTHLTSKVLHCLNF